MKSGNRKRRIHNPLAGAAGGKTGNSARSGLCSDAGGTGIQIKNGAGSVVTKDVPDYAVAVGSPAKIVKYLDPERFS